MIRIVAKTKVFLTLSVQEILSQGQLLKYIMVHFKLVRRHVLGSVSGITFMYFPSPLGCGAGIDHSQFIGVRGPSE